ncbi:hypothetical protein M422DRAFT_56635 [Sphaerobolus stellatus SS14]|uniref:Unplaced genomic scaffold SPHSTscaffold_487, whole genome shotgun sequence n=1 Tax=Sphaerobolus stellatus (strain SS14) TaxID=990650 RepID=A0A0C9T521_SPHS4|nr:hypothetical protein M422DRAFT_56635 [Sphaerobolus stellatus SS14]
MRQESPKWPYAFCGGDNPYICPVPLQATLSKKICFAQDRNGQHVAIKRLDVLADTDESRINRFLYEHKDEAAEICILPVIDILEYAEYCFAVMPRWGDHPMYSGVDSIGEALPYIHCLLKDIKTDNTPVNHFGAHHHSRNNGKRRRLRSSGRLTYALFDFDLALIIPTSSSTQRRLPAWRSFEIVTIESPYDTSQGELDYDPFIFEMGCLGIMLCQEFQHCTPSVPFLAPFLDRLITDKLDERLTSSKALSFFEKMYMELTPVQLAAPFPPFPEVYIPWQPDKYDRWHELSETFVAKWGHFRAPLPSVYTKFLRRICLTLWGKRCVWVIRPSMRLTVQIGNQILCI